MRWWLYNLLFGIGFLLVLPRFLYRMWRRGGYRAGFGQRLAAYAPEILVQLAAAPAERYWIHAVSVGEMNIAFRFLAELRSRRPAAFFVITTNTSTAHALAAKRLPAGVLLLYFPVDFSPVMRKVLACIQPAAIFLMEGEIWPNLVRLASARGVRLMVVNGRVSASSHRGYHRFRWFFAPVLRRLDLLLMQTEQDAARMISLGARPESVKIMGSAKYDVAAPSDGQAAQAGAVLQQAGLPADEPVLLGGSTWPGEERCLAVMMQKLRAEGFKLRLVLVPRHAERRAEVEAEVRAAGLSMVRRSELVDHAAARQNIDVLLVDTTGELLNMYAVADMIFVGKSLSRHGGQNMIEPAVTGKAVVVGPNTENFQDVVADLVRDEAIVQVDSAAVLADVVRGWLRDPEARIRLGARARTTVLQRQGVMRRSVDEVELYMAGHPGSGGV
jgi:3-deoxy-D-manno-octulosonic-acid transferase